MTEEEKNQMNEDEYSFGVAFAALLCIFIWPILSLIGFLIVLISAYFGYH